MIRHRGRQRDRFVLAPGVVCIFKEDGRVLLKAQRKSSRLFSYMGAVGFTFLRIVWNVAFTFFRVQIRSGIFQHT